MRVRSRAVTVGMVMTLAIALSACGWIGNLRAKQVLRNANTLYQAQSYEEAAATYEEVLRRDPNMTVVYFYLANSYDNLYRPSKPGASVNPEMLQKAIENYKTAVEREPDPKMKKLSLQYLAAAYGPDKLDDPEQAEPILRQMIELDPADTAAYFVYARIQEDAGELDVAEATLLKAKEAQPKQSAVYQQLAGYHQRQGEFDKVIETVQLRAAIEPDNPEVYYSLASYYWDEAFRNSRLTEAQRRDYSERGLEAVGKALQLKPDYVEAVVYKGLLLRVQAAIEKDAKRQQDLLKQANALQEEAAALKKKQAAGL